uniref:PPM-type phosphatase domain-containing protein n=1 Tax=Eiseniibacteriota bacterium TaxID=2212470 RepID=A0A832IBP1_UNCEI
MIELKAFYRHVERVFEGLGPARSARRLAEQIAPRLLEHLGGALGLAAVQLYAREGGAVRLGRQWGASRPDLAEEIARRLAGGGADEPPWAFEHPAGRAGVIDVDDAGGPYLALFGPAPGDLRPAPPRGEFLSALGSLRYAIAQHLHRRALEDVLEQARTIQMSLLPAGRPAFGTFDVCGASLPAQRVGGDVYDWLALDAETLALVVADASGHGLPAALQARDVTVGLRMGVERDLKITRMVEKLNRIVHRSGLVTRFVSLVFGELEMNGNLTYINAGHPPPLLLDRAGAHELTVGGPVLGPLPDAVYKMGFAHVDRGAALAMFSDGVIECRAPDGAMFGTEGVRAWLEAWREGPGEAAVADLLRRLEAHRRGPTPEDDTTVLYVRRPA